MKTGMKIIGWILLVFPTWVVAQATANTPKNTSFKEGERLTFRVYYNMGFIWINAGNATFSVQPDELNGKKAYHIVGDGKTAKNYEWVFKVNDKYQTYLDKETLLPMRFLRDVHEGGVNIFNDVTFNHEEGTALSEQKLYKTPPGTQDVLSAIYFARNIDYNQLKVGDKVPMNMFLDNQVYNVGITYKGKERIKTKMGTFNTIKINPSLIAGTIFKDGDQMTVWVTDDANHVPVRIESPILIGSIKVDLIAYDQLKNPMAGLISLND